MELEILKEAIVSVLKVYPGEITEDSTFLGDLGADSLDVYQIVLYVEDALHLSFDTEDIKGIQTVGEAVSLIKKAEEKNGNS
jgi:acyl carrier protein